MEKARILVVDDHEAGRYALAHCLRQGGYQVLEVESGEECLRQVRSGNTDLVLLDINLPGVSGIEVCQRLKKDPETALIPVLQISAQFTTDLNRIEGLESGADGYIVAPFEPREVLARVKTLLRVRDAEERLRQTVDLNPQVPWTATPDGAVEHCSERWRTISGLTREEIMHSGWMKLLHPDDIPGVQMAWSQAVKTGEPYDVELRLRTSDGTYRWMRSRAFPHRGRDGRILRWYGFTEDIHERVEAKRARQESEQELEKAARLSAENPDGVIRLSEGRWVDFANPIGMRLLETWSRGAEETPPEIVEPAVTALRDGRHRELEITCGQGTYLVSFAPIQPARYVNLYARDITARKRAEAALRENEEILSSIYSGLEAAITVSEVLDGGERFGFITANRACVQWTGVPLERWIGSGPGDLLPPADAAAVRARYREAVQEGRSISYEEQLRFPNRTTWALTTLSPVRDVSGTITRLIATSVDVTEQKLAEFALAREKELLTGVIDNIPVLLCIWDPELQRFQFNKHLTQVLGWTEADAAQGDFLSKAYPDPEYRQEIIQFMNSLQPGWRDWKTPTKTGQAIDCSWANIHLADGRHIGIAVDVRERKRAEKALQQSEERLRMAQEAARIGLWDYNPSTGALVWDARCRELFGLPPDAEVNYETFLAGLHPEDRDRTHATVQACFDPANGGRFNLDYRTIGLKNGGVVRWIRATGTTIFDPAGRPLRFIGTAQDITNEKRAEEALRESEEKLRAAFAEAAIGFALTTPEGRYLEVNPAYCMLTGYTAQELLERNFSQILHPDDYAANLALNQEMEQKRRGQFVIENRYVRKDGGVVWVRKSVAVVRNDQRVARWNVALVEDITERKRAEQQLRDSEERLRLAKTAGRIGIHDYNPVTGTLHWDERLRELWDLGPEDPVNYDVFLSAVHPDDRVATHAAISRALDPQSDGLCYVEYRLLRGPRERWIAATGKASFENGRAVRFIGTAQDITERKEFQAELERLVGQRTARLQELVAELEHFSYTITHDMRAPLRAMRGIAELLNERAGQWSETDRRKFVQRIITAAERMDGLITDSLQYSKMVKQELPLAPVDVGRLLQGMLETYPELQSANAEILLGAELPVVIGNDAALTQCFSNLLSNAVKFARRGERPRIRVKSEALGSGPPNANSQPEQWVRIWVEDDGVGISESMKPRLFHMFARGSHPQAGTGIGLALVRKVVDRMGGRVGVESEEGKGSRFWVDLRSGTRATARSGAWTEETQQSTLP